VRYASPPAAREAVSRAAVMIAFFFMVGQARW
jgi:hypothetical protein